MKVKDLEKYSDKFSNTNFTKKLQKVAKKAGAKLVYPALILYYALQSDEISLADKAKIIGALGYFIAPLDIAPDAIPLLGLADDASVLWLLLKSLKLFRNEELKAKANHKLKEWFDEKEISEVQNIKE